MPNRILAALVLVAGLLAGSARAAPHTAYFTGVRDQLVAMRDALVEPLTKPQKKRRTLIVKLLAAIDAPSPTLGTDVATAKTVTTAAVKPLSDDPLLPAFVKTLLTNLASDVKSDVQTLASRTNALTDPKSKTKVERSLTKVQKSVTDTDTAAGALDLKAMAAALLKATQGTDKVETALTKAEGGGGGGGPACPADIPDVGVDVKVTGAKGYSDRIQLATSPTPNPDNPAATAINACFDAGNFHYHCVTITIPLAPADIHVGTVAATVITYYDGNAHNWRREPGGNVQVLEESANRIGICIDTDIPYGGADLGNLPPTVTVKGYVVIDRTP